MIFKCEECGSNEIFDREGSGVDIYGEFEDCWCAECNSLTRIYHKKEDLDIEESIEEKLSKYICQEDIKTIMNSNTDIKLQGVAIDCINKGCSKQFLAIREYKSREVTCPDCNNKLKIRCFKNGRVNISIIK